MKKIIVMTFLMIGAWTAQAQISFGIKAGPNFSNVEGNLSTKMRTGFHAGAILELKYNNFAIQPELLYSMQGAKVTYAGAKDIDLNYVTVPILVKYYVLSDFFSFEAGPQFSFLANDNIDNTFALVKSGDFDFAVVGGAGINITKSLFLQGRYVIGLTDPSASADIKNRVIQFSVGYKF